MIIILHLSKYLTFSSTSKNLTFFFERPTFLPSVLHFKVCSMETPAWLKNPKTFFLKCVAYMQVPQKFLAQNPKKLCFILDFWCL